ncbi:MAG: hypothetical protein Q9164_003844 [Protoblastenia rupestris]
MSIRRLNFILLALVLLLIIALGPFTLRRAGFQDVFSKGDLLHVVNANNAKGTQPASEVNGSVLESPPPSNVEEEEWPIEKVVANGTLGFEKILAIGLPERFDRRDTLSLMASYQGVQLDWQDAVKGEDIDPKAWPTHWNTGETQHTMGELGCYRSHVNALRKIVDNRYSTALIIEDDADWDVSLKKQLAAFAHENVDISNPLVDRQLTTGQLNSPYGSKWDILWFGNCATPQAPDDSRTFVDPSSSQVHYQFYARGGIACTYGYAVTYESAQLLLGWLLDVDDPVDFAMSSWCQQRDCVVVWPELIGSHKAAGTHRKDTDIGHIGGWVNETRVVGETRNVKHSAILDMLDKVGLKNSPRSHETPNPEVQK